jgi:hypothetical protein
LAVLAALIIFWMIGSRNSARAKAKALDARLPGFLDFYDKWRVLHDKEDQQRSLEISDAAGKAALGVAADFAGAVIDDAPSDRAKVRRLEGEITADPGASYGAWRQWDSK